MRHRLFRSWVITSKHIMKMPKYINHLFFIECFYRLCSFLFEFQKRQKAYPTFVAYLCQIRKGLNKNSSVPL